MMALALGVWVVAQAAQAPAPGAPGQPMLGEPAPLFRLNDLKGKIVSLEALRGRIIVLHFGASW